MQKTEHQKSKCPKCKVAKGEPCRRKKDHEIAKKVHHGRPFWSSLVGMHPDDARYYIQLRREGKIKKAPKVRRSKNATTR